MELSPLELLAIGIRLVAIVLLQCFEITSFALLQDKYNENITMSALNSDCDVPLREPAAEWYTCTWCVV